MAVVLLSDIVIISIIAIITFMIYCDMKFLLSPTPMRSRWPIKQGFFLSYWNHKYVHMPSATGSIKRKEITRAIYFANTSKKLFHSKRVAENGITTMLHYYSTTFPGMEWLHSPKFYSLGVVGSY